MADIYNTIYNPDVLSCLANLSSDEIFTPPEVANDMLNLLPQELFENPDVRFLDPACKSGVFLREIAKRLLIGLEPIYPDLQERADHIFKEQLFGIAITELTANLSRRSLYCSKFANGQYSVCTFDKVDGNIRYKRIKHQWIKDKCIFCGASRAEYDRSDELETHAYEFIHTTKPEDIFNMRFDVIIGNPPYQLSDGGYNASAMPIYDKFIEKAKNLSPRYLTMIIPSRWFSGGRGLEKFRASMLQDSHLKELYDFENAEDCFPGVDIAGGVCYFLWDSQYDGPCKVVNNLDEQSALKRDLNEFPVFVRSNKALSIVRKVKNSDNNMMDSWVSGQRPFGLRTYARPEKEGELTLRWNNGKGPFPRDAISVGTDLIDKWKVIVSRISYEHAGKANKDGMRRVLSILEILAPGEICSETYIVVGAFEEENYAINLYEYLKTKFVRFLIYQATGSIMISKNNFIFVPQQDFSKSWTDATLYQKYNITEEEIAFIDSTIIPMETGGDN